MELNLNCRFVVSVSRGSEAGSSTTEWDGPGRRVCGATDGRVCQCGHGRQALMDGPALHTGLRTGEETHVIGRKQEKNHPFGMRTISNAIRTRPTLDVDLRWIAQLGWIIVMFCAVTVPLAANGLSVIVPESVNASAGEQTTILCTYTDDKPDNIGATPTIRWSRILTGSVTVEDLLTKKDSSIKGSWQETYYATIDGQASLKIYLVSTQDAGKYTCSVGDMQGTTELLVDPIPKIQSETRELILGVGDTLELSCVGADTLSWEWPLHSAQHITFTVQQNFLSGGQTSVLKIEQASTADTGEYRCVSSNPVQRWTSESVYVYITSDEEPLFVAVDQTDLVHYWGEPCLIPCRVTTPNATVTLHPQEMFSSDGSASSEVTPYDPTKGFSIQAELCDYRGNVSCRAVLGNRTDVQSFVVDFVGKPRLSVESPEKTILESTTFELVCTGVQPIQWFTPSGLETRLHISQTESYSPSRPATYTSVLRLTDAVYTDTAEYGCEYKKYAELDQPQLRSNVYVYVKSTDKEHFFLPPTEDIIYLKTSKEPFTVPCRVSDPNSTIPVSLLAFYSETNRQVKDFDNTWDLTFDPKVGFRVNPTAVSSPIQKLTMTCQLGLVGNTTFVVFKVQLEGAASKEYFRTNIESSSSRLIQGMGPFTVTCNVVIPFFQYPSWEIKYKPQVEIKFPNQENEAETNVETDDSFSAALDGVFVEKKLTIRNVSLLNSGTLECHFFNIERSVFRNTSLVVQEDGILVLTEFRSDQGVNEAVEGEQEVCFEVVMKSFPTAEYWWSKDGIVLTNKTAPGFTVSEHTGDVDNDLIISACVHNVTVQDGGSYSVMALNRYHNQMLTILLSVLEIPQVNMTVSPEPSYPDPPLYYTEQSYTLVCQAWGYPVPQITWQWRGCQDTFCSMLATPVANSEWKQVQTESWASVRHDAEMATEWTGARSVLNVGKPPQSGAFRCSAQAPRVQEVASAVKEFRLTDFKFSLPAAQATKTVYTSDPTNLTCLTNIYAFSDSMVWDWIPTGNSSDPIPIASDDERVAEQGITGYHFTSALTVNNTSAKDTGVYRCSAQQRNTGESIVVYQVQLNVKEITPPIFTRRLNKTYGLDRKKPVPSNFGLECDAYGDPAPSLTWFKDGRLITPQNQNNIRVETSAGRNNTKVSKLHLEGENTAAYGGTYTCHVKNKGGASFSEGRILIHESPSAMIVEDVYTKKIGENLTIACITTGDPVPGIVWMKKSRDSDREEGVPEDMYDPSTGSLVFKELKETDSGEYTCTAGNKYGKDDDAVTLIIHSNPYQIPLLIGGIVAGIIFLLLTCCLMAMAKRLCRYSRRAKRNSQNMELGLVNPRSSRGPMSPFRMSFKEEFEDQLPFDPKWEYPRDRLKLGAVIGQGAFGMVLKGVAAGINKNDRYFPVAVKTVKSDASYVDRKALFGELKMLIQVGHHLNVVNFLGACTQDSPPLIIVEFCPYGNLSEYLRSKRDNFLKLKSPKSELEENKENELNYADLMLREACVSEPPAAEYELVDKEAKQMAEKSLTVEDLVCFCFQVARGMEFLASRKCIHRDMAARNVLLGEKNVVKICDFGLSRSFYHDSDYIGSGKGLLPIKWMAPEAIFDKVFTTYSDIWSFGVFTWEVFSLGGSPYPGIQVDERFYNKMKSGYRMSCPEHAPKEVYQLMLECWSDEPKDRPMFSELAEQFGEQLECNTRQEYIDLNLPYQEGQYCELDFSKTSRKPDTVIEETESMQSSSDNTTTHNAAADHFNDPSYHRGPGTKESVHDSETTPTQSCQPKPEDEEGCSPMPTTEKVGETCPEQYAAISEALGEDSESATKPTVQFLDSLPEDPYQRETDEQLHTYASVKGTRPGLTPNNTPAGDNVRTPTEPINLSSTDDGNKLHTYASIKGPRCERTASDKELDRNHLYSSIKGLRPNATPDTTPKVKGEDQGQNDLQGEAASLLGKPTLPERDFQSASLGRLPDGRFRLQKPPLPRRDFSTASWSPETETLLSSPEMQETDVPFQPVYV